MKHIFIYHAKKHKNTFPKDNAFIYKLSEIPDSILYYTSNSELTKEFVKDTALLWPDAIFYSIGGDGTLNSVVNGIYGFNNKIHVVPFGTGNDYYRVISKEQEIAVDCGDVNGYKFINIASLGIDADIVHKVNREELQILKYQRNILKTLLTYRKKMVFLENEKHALNLLAFCIGKYYGKGIPINPNYSLNKGTFNIIEASNLNMFEMISCYLKIFQNKHLKDPRIHLFQGDNLKIKSLNPITCNIDGETFVDTEFHFSIAPKKITITNQISEEIRKIFYK